MTYPDELHAEIRRLFYSEHWKVGTIASQLNVHRDVVLLACGLLDRKAPQPRELVLGSYESFVQETLKTYPRLVSTRLMSMLVDRGYTGGITTLRNYAREVRPKPKPSLTLRVETLPAEQAQIDWAHVGQIMIDGAKRALWLFVFILSYSRALWGEFVFEMSSASLRRSMVRALAFFGGTPRTWLFDNPKTIALARHGKAVRFHPELLALADAYRVEPRVCDVRAPHQKGKVERSIRYLRDAFLTGREIGSIAQGNRELLAFLQETANPRPHPIRKGETVAQALEHEHKLLLPLPDAPPATDLLKSCNVSRDGFVRFDTNAYSVPPELVAKGKRATLAASDTQVRIVQGDTCYAAHERCWGKGRWIEDLAHRKAVIEQRKAAQPARGQDRLRTAAPQIDAIFERWILEGRNIGSLTAKAVSLLESYGEEVFTAAVEAVNKRGTHDVGAIAVVCEQLRQKANRPMPIPITLTPTAPEKDVIPHPLETYDNVNKKD